MRDDQSTIAPGVHILEIPMSGSSLNHLNAYLLEGRDGCILIDVGWNKPDSFEVLRSGINRLGFAFSDISKIIITHVHPDHFGLAGRVKQLAGRAKLIIHRWEAEVIESRYITFANLQDKMTSLLERHGIPAAELVALRSASMPVLEFVTYTFPDEVLYGGEIISNGTHELEVIWTPGHSPGHICLYEARHRLLFTGDHILPRITPNISYHVQSGDDPLGSYLSALRKLEKLPVEKVLPAHEQIFYELSERVRALVSSHQQRADEIVSITGNELKNAYEIASRVKWRSGSLPWSKIPALHKRGAILETIAHLEYLRWQGRIDKQASSDQVLYRAV